MPFSDSAGVAESFHRATYPLWVSGGLSGGDEATEAMHPLTTLRLVAPVDRQLRRWADEDWAAQQRAHGHERRWVIYDWDADEVLGHAYPSYEEADADAGELDNVIVVCLGAVAPVRSAESDADDGDE